MVCLLICGCLCLWENYAKIQIFTFDLAECLRSLSAFVVDDNLNLFFL